MATRRRRAESGRRPLRLLMVIGILVIAVIVIAIVWSPFGGKETSPDGNAPGIAAEGSGSGAGRKGGAAKPAGNAEGNEGQTGENGVDEPAPPDPDAEVTQADLDKTYDIVIAGGRVINPETKLDREGLNVGITGKTIEVVTSKPLKGTRVIDAAGLVVAPGFIDNLSYDPNPVGVWTKLADGVTSNIAMHGGTTNPSVWYDHYVRDMPPVHFGASFFVMQARNQFQLSRYDAASPEQIAILKDQAEEALNEGALGISFSLEYAPGTSKEEVLALMEVAQEYNVPVYFHGRYSDVQEPGTETDTMTELIDYAEQSGAAVHIDHINSTGGTFSMKDALAMIDEARAKGYDITACTYAYDYWGTYLNSARFDEGWQERFLISYEDLQIAGTNMRLNAETFLENQRQGKLAVAYAIPEEAVIDAFKAPYVMLGSDAILEPGFNNHPRASGNFARTIGLYVREQNVMPLIDAIDKMSLMPAERLEKQAPALKKKGRIAKGMDADIVIFDYDKISDMSTVERPDLPSAGFQYVLVEGQVALENGEINKNVRPGQPIRSEFVRVTEPAGTLQWEGTDYPLVAYHERHYVDLNALGEQGYNLTWDEASKTVTFEQGGAGSTIAGTDPSAVPVKGELMLERGYKAVSEGHEAELLSIGERAFVPLRLLEDLGIEAVNDGDVWTING